jgi:hypothetical protein
MKYSSRALAPRPPERNNMNSPSAALTWQIWCRHRKRLIAAFFVLLCFALFYSRLCVFIGLNLDSPNALDSIVEQAAQMHGTWPDFFKGLAWVILVCAPLACMVITLFYVVWVFTFTDLNPRVPFSFPKRLFTLPISTLFLMSRLVAGGTTAVLLVFLAWTRLVHLPHVEVFDGFHDGLTWITLLVLSQAIIWSLDAFPFTRVLLLVAATFLLFVHVDFQWYRWLETHRTPVELLLIFMGCGLAFVGLDKIRHGGWQRWFWEWRLPLTSKRTELPGPNSFRTAAQAEFWFEWRRHGRKVFYTVCALTVVPVLLMIPELLLHPGSESGDATFELCVYLMAVPIFIHFFHGVSYERTIPQFTANRPLDNGEIIVAQWKATAVSTVLSWVVTCLSLGVVALVGDLSDINDTLWSTPAYLHFIRPLIPVILPGVAICTWAVGADRVWVGATLGTWIHRVYNAVIFAVVALGLAWLFAFTHRSTPFREIFIRILPGFLAFLVGLKFMLAQWAFRAAYKKRLIARHALIQYLSIWGALAAFLLVPVMVMCHQESALLPLCLGIILMLPLARIGFAPIALNLGRHR